MTALMKNAGLAYGMLGAFFLLGAGTLCAQQTADTSTTPHSQRWQAAVMTTGVNFACNEWQDTSLCFTGPAHIRSGLGVELLLHRGDRWMVGGSSWMRRNFFDALKEKYNYTSYGTAIHDADTRGDQVGLDLRSFSIAATARYSLLGYPRRHRVAFGADLMASIGYLMMIERPYARQDIVAATNSSGYYALAPPRYQYGHKGLTYGTDQVGHGAVAQISIRGALHLGARISLFCDLAMVFSTPVHFDGSTMQLDDGIYLIVQPHSMNHSGPGYNAGLAVTW